MKPADKCGAVVVWDRDLYIAEAHRQLDDTTHQSYQTLPIPSGSTPGQKNKKTKTQSPRQFHQKRRPIAYC